MDLSKVSNDLSLLGHMFNNNWQMATMIKVRFSTPLIPNTSSIKIPAKWPVWRNDFNDSQNSITQLIQLQPGSTAETSYSFVQPNKVVRGLPTNQAKQLMNWQDDKQPHLVEPACPYAIDP